MARRTADPNSRPGMKFPPSAWPCINRADYTALRLNIDKNQVFTEGADLLYGLEPEEFGALKLLVSFITESGRDDRRDIVDALLAMEANRQFVRDAAAWYHEAVKRNRQQHGRQQEGES